MNRIVIFSALLLLNPMAYGMYGGGQDTLYQLIRTLGASRVDQIMSTLDRKLTPHEADLLIQEAQKEQAKHDAERAKFSAEQAQQTTKQIEKQVEKDKQREVEETRRQTIRAEADSKIAQQNAIAANAKALEEQTRIQRVREEAAKEAKQHLQKMEEQEQQQQAANKLMLDKNQKDKENLVEKARLEAQNFTNKSILEKQNAMEVANHQDLLQRKQETDRIERDKKAQLDAIARDEQAQKDRIAREEKAYADKLKAEVEAAKEKAIAEARAQAEKEKELKKEKFKDWKNPSKRKAMREMADDESERRKQENNSAIKTKITEFKNAFFEFTDNKERQKKVGTFIAATTVVTAGGILTFRYGLPIAQEAIRNYLFTPDLIEESSHSYFGSLFGKKKIIGEKFENLYFDDALQQTVNEIKTTLANTKKNKGVYLNYLFYGSPGTGKTATARALAYESGMDFAFMTGGSVLDLLRSGKAIKRLKDVFSWAKNSKKGLILFIDEADAFLANPNGDMSEELNSVLKAFLNYTGTESKDFVLILSTNHPNQLSKAVLSRVGYRQQIHFATPSLETRKKMIAHFMNKYLCDNKLIDSSSIMNDETINYIAKNTQGFVGRDILYLILGIEKATLANQTLVATQAIIQQIVAEAMAAYNQAQKFESYA